MDLAVQIFQIVFYSIGALFMITFSIIGVWGFIIFNKTYKAKRIQNYLLEKIYQAINQITYKNSSSLNENSEEELLSLDNLIDENEN
ncbi:Vpu [Clostridium sp.]|uniref:Vpu n=1 Tax=Clostridium sp. TaxID=1506 RepID=UPI0025B977CF|nr:Vpu [Clostridium sp.]